MLVRAKLRRSSIEDIPNFAHGVKYGVCGTHAGCRPALGSRVSHKFSPGQDKNVVIQWIDKLGMSSILSIWKTYHMSIIRNTEHVDD